MELKKEEFSKMYYSMTNEELAAKLGVHKSTIEKNAKKLGLKKNNSYITGRKKKLKILEG